jgi:transmembrane protein 231
MFFTEYQFRFSSLEMTGLIYLSGQGAAGRRLDVSGDISLYQKQPLAHRGRDSRYLPSPISLAELAAAAPPSPMSVTTAAPLSLASILQTYGRRNVTVRLDNVYTIWGSGPRPTTAGGHQRFVLEANIQYPASQTVVYTPGLWQTLKWGWIQYLAILVVFVYVFNTVKSYVFYEQILPTSEQVPWKK